MPNPIPFPSRKKPVPAENNIQPEIPESQTIRQDTPTESAEVTTQPSVSPAVEEKPEATPEIQTKPTMSENKEVPSGLKEENCIEFNGQKIEIKPTKLKYFRNKAAAGYGVIKAVPIHTLLTYDKGVIDEERDADHVLFDFLVAAFDDSTFVRDNYDNFTPELIDNIVKIFGRINNIEEKEEQARKNREAQAKH